jgi:hypothetical protein
MNSLFPGRDQEAGTDAAFDAMLQRALERSERAPIAQPRHAAFDDRIKRGVERIAPPEKTPLPPLLRAYWVLIALGLLLLLAALSNHRQETSSTAPASIQPAPAIQPTPVLPPTPASTPSSVSPARPVFLPQSGSSVPRAQLVRLPPSGSPRLIWSRGTSRLLTMPYGVEVLGLLKGSLANTELLPQSGNQLGDTWVCRTHTLGLDNAPRLGPADVGRPVSIQLTLEVASSL